MIFVSASQFHVHMKVVVGAFNKEKAIVGDFPEIVKFPRRFVASSTVDCRVVKSRDVVCVVVSY